MNQPGNVPPISLTSLSTLANRSVTIERDVEEIVRRPITWEVPSTDTVQVPVTVQREVEFSCTEQAPVVVPKTVAVSY